MVIATSKMHAVSLSSVKVRFFLSTKALIVSASVEKSKVAPFLLSLTHKTYFCLEHKPICAASCSKNGCCWDEKIEAKSYDGDGCPGRKDKSLLFSP